MGLPLGASPDSDGSAPDAQVDRDSAGDAPLGLPAWSWSLLALALGIAGTLWAAHLQQERMQVERRAQLEHVAESGFAALHNQLQAAEMLARAVQSVFLASEDVTAEEFANVYANLRPRERFPSLQALAFARREPGAGGERYVTELVAPEAGNQAILGLVVNDQPANLDAVLRSRDADRVALSAPFRLAQVTDPAAPADGITLRLPVYGPGPPPVSVPERRWRIVGSLAISFRASDLIGHSLPEQARRQLHVEVADATGAAALPLFDSHEGPHPDVDPAYRFDRELRFGGRVWRVGMHPVGGAAEAGVPWSMVLPGLLASALLALLVWSAATTRRRALELGTRMSRRFRESEERFRALNELLPALVLLADEHGRITYANQAARNRLGEGVAEVDLAALFEDPDVRARMREPEQAACSNAEAMLRSTNGDRFWASLSIAPVVVSARRKLLMVASDVSEQRQLTELLSYQASHDALTELYNRREFERRVERVLAHTGPGSSPGALLYIDLDQFKLINDTSGHIAGDHLLTQLAAHMREQLRGGDVLARLGGDEFGVLAANVGDLAGARRIAERLREQIDGYVFSWEQRSYPVSASIGGVMIDQPDISMKELFAQADTACYMAKEGGRNRVHFYSEQDDETAQRRSEMEWVNRLRWALEEDRLLLDYQELRALPARAGQPPQIEVLLRLRDEDGRIVLPGAFLPAAERYGLMPLIDRWVIETTLANFDRLHDQGPALALCEINLSGASIEDDSLADLILALLERHRVDPARVCFEITETVAVRNLARVGAFIARLREVGCLFALDDFGAGMSSFGYLKNLPVDFIKIDGSFIRDIARDPMSQSIVQAVTDIGHQRGMQVIAEWVSSGEIIERLVEIGVDYAQGFALHKPEPVLFQRS
jgi:diguanylate cyclase (GGDEF)-like protein/PAS domain S-box-containing protein